MRIIKDVRGFALGSVRQLKSGWWSAWAKNGGSTTCVSPFPSEEVAEDFVRETAAGIRRPLAYYGVAGMTEGK